MKDYHINIFYCDEDNGHIADIPDLPACSAFGIIQEEALNHKMSLSDNKAFHPLKSGI